MRPLLCALFALSLLVPVAAAGPAESNGGTGIGPLTHFTLWQDDPLHYVVFADGKAPLVLKATLAAGSDMGFLMYLDATCQAESMGDVLTSGGVVELTCDLPRGHYRLELSLGMGTVRGTLRVSNGMLQGIAE